MKKLLIIALSGVIMSCSTVKRFNQPLAENEFFVIRKYAGDYLDYRHTGSNDFTGTNIIWIKTTMEDSFGKISAYGEKCDFSVGDRLYLRRTYYTPGGLSGYWVYYIENDSSVFYRATEFQHDRKVPIERWFEHSSQ